MVCTGAKSEEDSRLAARKYARIVQKLGFPTKFKDFKIQNMVTTHGMEALLLLMITHIHIFRLARATSSSRSVWRVWCLPTLSSPATNQSCSLASSTGLCYIKHALGIYDLLIMIFRMVKPRIVLLIFVSGKVVLTGAKVRQEIYEAFDNIYPILKNFKKQ